MLTAVVLLHDNARPHTARRTAAVLMEFGGELFDHPLYSLDLTGTFICTSKNSCPPVNVLTTTKSGRRLSHASSIHSRQSSTTEGCES
ncbi:hypothetical protein TNCV_3016721 [Trichonephila clavipes]|nr:hypothetical protein TNCV_3016721 [Trichonephila clavipes]